MKEHVNHPKHYNEHPSGVEAIEVVRLMSFNLGSSFKYVFRRDDKEIPMQDLEKAIWYVKDEIEQRRQKYENYGDTFVSKITRFLAAYNFKMVSSDKHFRRSDLVWRIGKCEENHLVSEIFYYLHLADSELFDTNKLELVKGKLQHLRDEYQLQADEKKK